MIRSLVAVVGCLIGFDGPGSPAPESYETLRAEAGRDADSQVKLALWCEAHGLQRERLRHLAAAVLADPSNALARGLMGMVEFQGRWKRPDAVADAAKSDLARADLLAEYAGHRVKAPLKADAQYKLALWCEEKGLRDEARAHLATVVRLDPNHAEAWKRLGFKKVGNRWTTDAQAQSEKAQHLAQQAADKRWKNRLEKLRDALSHKGARKDEAERELATITDPRAVPMVWKVFVQGHEKHRPAGVQLLGQIDATASSRALASLALFDRSDEVRRRAVETLRRRDAREYADVLVTALRDKIKYEVKNVGGPGSPGVLFVEGKEANMKRIYDPPAPQIAMMPGDTMSTDAYGLPVLVHHQYLVFERPISNQAGILAGNPTGVPLPLPGAVASDNAAARRVGAALPSGVAKNTATIEALAMANDPYMQQFASGIVVGIGPQSGLVVGVGSVQDNQTRIPVGRIMAEANRVAASAQDQLQRDVSSIESINRRIAIENERVTSILRIATGESLPPEPKPWRTWFVDQLGFKYNLATPTSNPTIIENVSFTAETIPIEFGTQSALAIFRHSCFAQGTSVRTLSGATPIETIASGDLVLAQDTKTGKLAYRPVVMAHHNPPSPTFRVTFGDDSIVTSPSHRFWVAGRGWVMARELKVGDPIRTLGDVAKVTAIESDKVQLVYNLDVADDADFFVGKAGALVHDNTLPDLRLAPFDAASVAAVK
jgi:tetratricopeptide (TPR) repeat protein